MNVVKKLLICILFISSLKVYGQGNRVQIKFSETSNLELKREAFNAKGKKIEYLGGKIVLGINGKPVFGTDGEMPKYQLAEAILTIKGVSYNLDISDIYNPWFGEHINEGFFKLQELAPNQYKLFAMFSDGAGLYGAEWLIRGKSSIRTILSDDETILYEYFEDKMKKLKRSEKLAP